MNSLVSRPGGKLHLSILEESEPSNVLVVNSFSTPLLLVLLSKEVYQTLLCFDFAICNSLPHKFKLLLPDWEFSLDF